MITTNDQNVKFDLLDGSIELINDELIIKDKAKKDRLLLLITTISNFALSLSILYKWTQSNDRYHLVIGFLLLISSLGLLWKWYKEFNFIENQIQLNDIDYFKLVNVKLSDTKVGLIRTRNKSFRRVKMNSTELDLFRKYIETKSIKIIS